MTTTVPAGSESQLDAATLSALGDLRFHWSEAYDICYDETDGRWLACYKSADIGEELSAATSDELRQMIRVDHPKRRRAEQAALARLVERSSI
jgi:hypothetical protein